MDRQALICIIAALAACTSTPDEPHDLDGKQDGVTWEQRLVTKVTPNVVIETVAYRSSGLLVLGQVCRPRAPGRHKIYIYAHGGFVGIADGMGMEWNGGQCEALAEQGWVVVVPAYRGEDGSEGAIEVCLGEVDDLMEMTRIVLAQAYADPDRVAIVGASHGGCITLRALQRGLPAQVAVDLFGATDWSSIYHFWLATVPTDPSIPFLRDAIGGTPETAPVAYAQRSPLSHAGLQSWPGSLLIVHGVADEVVPGSNSCAFAAVEASFETYHVDVFGRVVPTAPLGCAGLGQTWLPALPPTWSGSRHLVMFDGSGHGATVPIGTQLLATAALYLAAKMP